MELGEVSIAAGSVFHVIPSLEFGGAEKTLIELLSDPVARHNTSVVVFSGGGALEAKLSDLGVRLIDLNVSNGLSLCRAIGRLSALIRAERPKIVQSWLYYADISCLLALWLSGRRRRTKLCWGVRCTIQTEIDFPFRLRAAIWACTRLSHLPDIVIYNSHAGQITHAARGYRPRRAAVILNGIDCERFRHGIDAGARVREELGWNQSDIVVAMIARNHVQKGYDVFFDLVAHRSDIRAVVVGKGTESLPYNANIAVLGVRDDVPEILSAADILMSCSHYGEGFPNVVAEAMATGRPVVCTDIGEASRIVGGDGFVVPPGDTDALANALDTLIADPDLRNSLGQKGKERIASQFPLKKMVAEFTELYREIGDAA
jgi:glycosyltransferase involved in cell wall biosynthesis